MKLIPLRRGQFAMVDDEDYDDLIMCGKWHAHKVRPSASFYARRTERTDGVCKIIAMHRFIMKAKHGELIDHIDMNGLNNQKSNLRKCTYSQNCCNVKPRGFSKFLGVTYDRGSRGRKVWAAFININKKGKRIGRFYTEIDAAKAYDEAAKIIHGEFANLNFKTEQSPSISQRAEEILQREPIFNNMEGVVK